MWRRVFITAMSTAPTKHQPKNLITEPTCQHRKVESLISWYHGKCNIGASVCEHANVRIHQRYGIAASVASGTPATICSHPIWPQKQDGTDG
jgi:hypothetical protein